jgi:CRP/FNR family nitrogen fixation transcriptional regulator
LHTLASTAAARTPAGFVARPSTFAATPRTIAKDEELFCEGDEADCFFKVISGAVCSYKLLSDGRRQIDAFHLPGDFFGLEAGDIHRFSVEAVAPGQVLVFRRSRLPAVVREDPAFGEEVMSAVLTNLERAQDHMLLLGRKTAQEKMATFLLGMAERLSDDDEHFDLPMPRADIADHLGLTIETVSRTLTQFVRSGLIRLMPAGRSIALCNKMALKNLDA